MVLSGGLPFVLIRFGMYCFGTYCSYSKFLKQQIALKSRNVNYLVQYIIVVFIPSEKNYIVGHWPTVDLNFLYCTASANTGMCEFSSIFQSWNIKMKHIIISDMTRK